MIEYDLEEVRDAVLSLEYCSSTEETYRLAIDAVDRLLESGAMAIFVERDDPDTSRISADFAPVAATGDDDATAVFRESTCEGLVEQSLRTDTTDGTGFGLAIISEVVDRTRLVARPRGEPVRRPPAGRVGRNPT